MEPTIERLLAKVQTKKNSFVGMIMAIMKAAPEETKPGAKHLEVPTEEAAVKIREALKDRYGDRHLAVGRR
jgi:hypothetical protein